MEGSGINQAEIAKQLAVYTAQNCYVTTRGIDGSRENLCPN